MAISIGGNEAVDAKQQHGFTASRAAAEVEGADVDAGFAQQGTDPADEAGGVLVDDVHHVAGQFGLDLDPEQLDQARLGVRNRVPATERSPSLVDTVTRISVW